MNIYAAILLSFLLIGCQSTNSSRQSTNLSTQSSNLSSQTIKADSETTINNEKTLNSVLIEYQLSTIQNTLQTANKLNELVKNKNPNAMMFLAFLTFGDGDHIESLYWFRQSALHGHYGAMSFLCLLAQDRKSPEYIYYDGLSWCAIAKENERQQYNVLSKRINNIPIKLDKQEVNKKYLENKSKIKIMTNHKSEIDWKLIEKILQLNNKKMLANIEEHENDAFPVFAFIPKNISNDDVVNGVI
ncbi:MAG: hypothetical protein HRU38_26455 [Saccharospirillaceae bacterium]|nr:hypothetical protein [Saccharospirillaceae bacterium]